MSSVIHEFDDQKVSGLERGIVRQLELELKSVPDYWIRVRSQRPGLFNLVTHGAEEAREASRASVERAALHMLRLAQTGTINEQSVNEAALAAHAVSSIKLSDESCDLASARCTKFLGLLLDSREYGRVRRCSKPRALSGWVFGAVAVGMAIAVNLQVAGNNPFPLLGFLAVVSCIPLALVNTIREEQRMTAYARARLLLSFALSRIGTPKSVSVLAGVSLETNVFDLVGRSSLLQWLPELISEDIDDRSEFSRNCADLLLLGCKKNRIGRSDAISLELLEALEKFGNGVALDALARCGAISIDGELPSIIKRVTETIRSRQAEQQIADSLLRGSSAPVSEEILLRAATSSGEASRTLLRAETEPFDSVQPLSRE